MKRAILLSLILTAAIANAQWPTFHGGPQRTGFSPAIGPETASILWSYDMNGPMINSPAIGPDGTIYTGSVWDESLQPTAYIHAINPDGTMKWRFETGWLDDQTVSSPTLGPEGNVYVGGPKNIFYALNSNGQEIWRYTTLDSIVTHAVVSPNGTVYAKLDGFLIAFSATGTVQWQFPIGSNTPSSPTLATDGTIYVPGSAGLFAINPNGTQKWKFTTADTYTTPAVRSDGKIIYANANLYAINPDGTQAWQQFGYGSAPWSAPTIDADGNIYLIEDWELRKHSPTGQVLWTAEFIYDGNRLEQAYNAPIVDAAGRLYFGLGTGKRYALDSAKGLVAYDSNGTKLYNLLLPETPSTSSPAMGTDGTIYIGCLDGKLYAIGGAWMETGPSSLNVTTGVTVSGGLPEIMQADDQYLQLRPGIVFTSSQKPIAVEVAGTLPTQLPVALQFVIESRGTSGSLTQYVEAWNYTSSTWVQIAQGATPTVDGRTTVNIANPAQYVDASRNIKVRVSYKASGPVFTYPWTIQIDQVQWRSR